MVQIEFIISIKQVNDSYIPESNLKNFFQLLNCCDQEQIFNTCGISESKINDVTEGPETDTIYRTMRILNLSEGLRVTEAGIRLFADSDCNEQRAAAARQRIIRMLAFLLL